MSSNQKDILKGDILIVDDSPDNLRVLSTTLTNRGYDVRCVRSGAMALIGIQTSPPDLILLDIRMPELNGYETCQRIKSNEQTREIPVIFLSALDETLDKVQAFEVGGADYITKPFEIEEVLARIEHQLTIRRLQKEIIQKNLRLQQEIDEHKRTESALRDAKEAAEAANYAKSEFLARMSHELRTPLNAILGFAELMQNNTSLTAEHQGYLEAIYRSGQHLLKFINKILKITQLENKYISLNEETLDLIHLLDEVEANWQPKLGYKNIQFAVEQSLELPQYIHSDKSKLKQILNTLLEYFFEFTTRNRLVLRVHSSANLVLIANNEEEILIEDQQPIVPKMIIHFEFEDIALEGSVNNSNSLLEVFSRREVEQKSIQEIGLGFPITRQFVQRMGGDISISSKPASNTTISFFIQVTLAESKCIPTQLLRDSSEFPEKILDTTSFSSPRIYPFNEDLTPISLRATMSPQWINAVHQAAVKGFDHQILQLLQEIPPTHPSFAVTLKDWTDNFWFDRIINLTKPNSD